MYFLPQSDGSGVPEYLWDKPAEVRATRCKSLIDKLAGRYWRSDAPQENQIIRFSLLPLSPTCERRIVSVTARSQGQWPRRRSRDRGPTTTATAAAPFVPARGFKRLFLPKGLPGVSGGSGSLEPRGSRPFCVGIDSDGRTANVLWRWNKRKFLGTLHFFFSSFLFLKATRMLRRQSRSRRWTVTVEVF